MKLTARPSCSIMLLWLWSTAAFLPHVNGFAPIQWMPLATRTEPHSNSNSNSIPLMATLGANEEDNEKDAEKHPMADTSRLSHAMLKVPSVDKTAKYWTDKGGSIRISRNKPGTFNGEAELMSAFVELGRQGGGGESDGQCFALELVGTSKEEENYNVGNCISYIGVSMLLQFQNNLLGPITGEKPQEQGDEPNGIPIKSSASAPGDFLSRFSLQSRDLVATHAFYSTILGMDALVDENMVCLRYTMQDFPGVPTTLVFEATQDEIIKGDCLDHLAIVTKLDIDELHKRIQESEYSIFMNPTEMFGKQVMGVLDPNGYKVVVASE